MLTYLRKKFRHDHAGAVRLLGRKNDRSDPLVPATTQSLSDPAERHRRELSPRIAHRGDFGAALPPHDANGVTRIRIEVVGGISTHKHVGSIHVEDDSVTLQMSGALQ